MRLKTTLKSTSGIHSLDLDLTNMNLTSEQRPIVAKLADSLQNEVIDVEEKDPCEEGKCLASKFLTPDEFSKVRDLRAELATVATPAGIGIIIDFCVHPLIKLN